MDPLSALGIAASVAQFLDLGFKLAKKMSEYNKSTLHEVPKSMQSINTQLPLLLNALNRVQSDIQVERLDTDTKCILRGVVHGCTKVIKEVDEVMNKVARQPGESLAVKLKKVLSSLRHDETIAALDKSLQTYIQVLILHHVVDAADVPPPLPEDTKFYEVRERFADPYNERPREIAKLDELFYSAARSQVKEPTVVVLRGDKGVGKSQVALDYCRQTHALGQFQSIFWLNASTPEALNASIESMAAIIRRSTEGRSEEKRNFVKTFLENLWHPWLLVLDGYDHKAFGYEPALQRLPQRGYGAILVTSRQLGASALGTIVEVNKFLTREEEENLSYSLSSAIEKKNWPKVQEVVATGFNVNQCGRNLPWPFVSRAACIGFDQAVDLLLKLGANMDLTPDIHPALYWAAYDGYVGILNRLLDEEDRIQFRLKPGQYDAAVMAAIEHNHFEAVKILAERRLVNLDTKDQYGRTSFVQAMKHGNTEMAKYLVQHGAGPKTPEEKSQALTSAISENNLDLLKFLVDECKFDPNVCGEKPHTALFEAAALSGSKPTGESQGLDIMRYLLEHGANPMLAEADKEIPLHAAALRDQVDKVELLLKHGSDPAYDEASWSPITQAAKYKSPKVFPILLAWPIEDAEKKASFHRDVLQAAARWDYKELALAVLKANPDVDINAKDWRGETPLMLAVGKSSVPIARMLIRKGARQDIPNDENQYPLLLAAENGLDLVVRDLVKAAGSGAFDIRDESENSALHLAVKAKQASTVQVLLEQGADRDDMNAYGETPVDIAEEMKLDKIMKIFKGIKIDDA